MASGDSAWAASDPLARRRLNRDWISGRVSLPIFDVDINDAVSVTGKAVAGATLTTSVATLYTVPGSGVAVTQIHSITLVNFSGSTVNANVYLVESGGSAALATQIFGDVLLAGEAITLEGPWFLAVGATLRASASITSSIALSAGLLEYKTNPDGLTLKVINGVALGNTVATYYTVPGSGVRQALVLAVTLFNSHSSGLTTTVHRVPSGGSASNATIVFSGSLLTKETAIFGPPFTLAPGDFMAALAGTGALASARFTVLEAA